MTAVGAWPVLATLLAKAADMSIDTASMPAERSVPSSSKKPSRVAVSLPSAPQTILAVSWLETRAR